MVTVLVLMPLAYAAINSATRLSDRLGEAHRIKELGKEGEHAEFADFAVTFTRDELEAIKANEEFCSVLSRAVERGKHHKGL